MAQEYRIVFRIHAIQRMFERSITDEEVRSALKQRVVIADYPNDTPYPSQLILGKAENRPLHIVLAENTADREIIIVTVYEPDPENWSQDFKTRLKR